MEKTGLIYRAYDFEEISYVGQTTKTLDIRRKQHETSTDNIKFHVALREKGLDAFKWEILEDNIPIDKLTERERYWADYYDSVKNGYNGCIPNVWPISASYNMKGKENPKTSAKLKEYHIMHPGEMSERMTKLYEEKPEIREKLGISARGKKWMNNGIIELLIISPWDKDMLVFGWKYGRLPDKEETYNKRSEGQKRRFKNSKHPFLGKKMKLVDGKRVYY